MAITITAVEPEFNEVDGRHAFETYKVTAATGAAGDTATVKSRLSKPDYIIGGPFAISSVSGATVTIKALVALGTDATGTLGFQLYGRAGSGI